MAKDQSDILKEILKQSKNPGAIQKAKEELASAAERKAEITSQLRGSITAPLATSIEPLKEVPQPQGVLSEKSAADIKDILKESKNQSSSLKTLVKLNQKSIEDNSEVFGRLEKTMNALLDAIEERARKAGTPTQNTSGFSRSVNGASTSGGNPPGNGGGFNIPDLGGFRRTIGGGAAPAASKPGGFGRFMRGAAKIGAGAIGGGLLGGAVYGMMSPEQQAWLNEMTGGNGDLVAEGAGSVLGTAVSSPVGALVAGGGALSYGAAKFTEGEGGKKIYEMTKDNPLAGAMAGDYALASSIQHGPKKTEEEINKEREQLKDAPWYTRLYGIGKDKYLSKDAEASDVGNLGSNQAPVNPNMLEPGVTPDISGGFQITGREEFDPALVNKEAQLPGVTPDTSGVLMPAKETGNSIFTDIGNKIKGVTNEVSDAYGRGTSGTLEYQESYKNAREEWRQLGGEDSDTEGFNAFYDEKQKELRKTGATRLSDVSINSARSSEQTIDEQGKVNDRVSKGVSTEKSLFGSTTLGALVSKEGLHTGSFTGTSMDNNGIKELHGTRTSGGLFGADKYEVFDGKDFVSVDKSTYMKMKDQVENNNIEAASKTLEDFKKFMQTSQQDSGMTAMGDIGSSKPGLSGSDVTGNIIAPTVPKNIEPPAQAAPPIIINKEGDVVNQVTNNNTSGGSSGGVGSPSRVPSPWDSMTLGKSWEAYP